MHERKAKMTELTDAFVALPGGIGTFDELFEAWTWNALGYHAKPFCLLNVAGFWDGLTGFLDHADGRAASSPARRGQLLVADEPAEAHRHTGRSRAARAKAWSGKGGEGAGVHESDLLGIVGIAVILAARFPAFVQPPRDPPARRRRGLRAAGGDRRCSCSTRPGAGRGIQALSNGVADLLGYANQGHRIPVRPERTRTRSPTPSRSARCR